MRRARAAVTVLFVASAAVVVAQPPAAVEAYAPGEKVAGKSQAEWGAAWWQWALAPKKDRSPVTDKTGEFAAADQPDAVWFLAGTFGGTVKRTCAVPAGRPVLVPVFNFYASQPTKDRDADGRKKLEADTLAEAKGVVDRADGLSLEVNGKAVADLTKQRFVSPLFDTVGPGFFEAVHPSFSGKQTGVSDGYWVMLKPLPAGTHTVRIRSKLKPEKGEPPFEMDVTYALTVAAKK